MPNSNPVKLNGSIETLRIISAISIIWFHIPQLPGRGISYSGLIIFVILLGFFPIISQSGKHLTDKLSTKAKRIIIPWAAWFSIYLTLGILTRKLELSKELLSINFVLTGPWIGLWFLPFAFMALSTTIALSQKLQKVNPNSVLAIATTSVIAAYYIRTLNISSPWSQWVHAIPALVFGWYYALTSNSKRLTITPTLVLATLSLITFHPSIAYDSGLLTPYIIATLACSVAITKPTATPQALRTISSACFGVYLLHGGIISAILTAAPKTTKPTLFILTVISAFAITITLRRLRFFRFIT